MKTLIVIPSRYASTRFPQKPLHLIAGKSLLSRVADIARICAAGSPDISYVIATDHAPHTLEEKQNSYFKAPSGGPLVQHCLPALLDMYHQNKISLEKIVEKTAHAVATLFEIEGRGYLREGYHADIALVDLNSSWEVTSDNILYKCGWSPFEGHQFKSQVTQTIVSGNLVYDQGQLLEGTNGQRLAFDR